MKDEENPKDLVLRTCKHLIESVVGFVTLFMLATYMTNNNDQSAPLSFGAAVSFIYAIEHVFIIIGYLIDY